MPFGFLLYNPIRDFQDISGTKSFACPGSPRRWNLRLSDCGRSGGNGQCANRTCEGFRSWIIHDNSLWFHLRSYHLLKIWFFLKKRKEAIPTILPLYWNSPNFSARSSESSTAATARRWAWKILPKGLTDSQPVSHLFHQLCWCFENISWNFQGFLGKALVFVHAGENVVTQCEFHIWSIAPGRQESGSSAGVSRILWCNCWSLHQLGPALTQSRLSKHKADAIHSFSPTRVILLRQRISSISISTSYLWRFQDDGQWWLVVFLLFGELFPFFSVERWIV